MASLKYWYLEDMVRFRREREALTGLSARTDWLTIEGYRFDESGRVLADCEIDVGHRQFPIALRYPDGFPHSPPSVLPRNAEDEQWSFHQFGKGGELCLEFRFDNWSPDILGAQMVESAYRLLSQENQADGAVGLVASAHVTTEGQRLRGARDRFLLSREVRALFQILSVGMYYGGVAVALYQAKSAVYHVATLENGDDCWNDPSFPSVLIDEGFRKRIRVVRVPSDAPLPDTSSTETFASTAAEYGYEPADDLFIVLRHTAVYAYRIWDTSVVQLWTVFPEPEAARISPDYAVLGSKRVGVIGCGSMGSKIAMMLARAGVSSFVLADDDILMPDNFVRHDLDWRDAGQHKATALAERLQRVRAGVESRARCLRLGGQESSSAAESLLNMLSECDLIVDATANHTVSNILSGLVAATPIPVIWAEVFAGGIGGLVARHRPGKEPSIPLMRRHIENWFAEQNLPSTQPAHNYEQPLEDITLIADDADVTAIAAPAARLALDILIARDPSYFPYSIYVIGLAPCPLFAEPFQTQPLLLPDAPEEVQVDPLSGDQIAEEIAFLTEMVTQQGAA
jgi:sulfur-carrier protein adenylyltransferase/sulfurtransferase